MKYYLWIVQLFKASAFNNRNKHIYLLLFKNMRDQIMGGN